MHISRGQLSQMAHQQAAYIDALSAIGLAGEGLAVRQATRRADNVARAHLPRVEIGSGDAQTPPQYAYSRADLDRTWGQYRTMAPGWRRDVMERGYRARVAAFLTKR